MQGKQRGEGSGEGTGEGSEQKQGGASNRSEETTQVVFGEVQSHDQNVYAPPNSTLTPSPDHDGTDRQPSGGPAGGAEPLSTTSALTEEPQRPLTPPQ